LVTGESILRVRLTPFNMRFCSNVESRLERGSG
jgi:hypothetical protein